MCYYLQCNNCICLYMPQTLYTYPENWRAFKAQIAAQYSGASLKVASAAPAFTFGQTNRSPAFLKNFPLGKVCSTTLLKMCLMMHYKVMEHLSLVNTVCTICEILCFFCRYLPTREVMASVCLRVMPLPITVRATFTNNYQNIFIDLIFGIFFFHKANFFIFHTFLK